MPSEAMRCLRHALAAAVRPRQLGSTVRTLLRHPLLLLLLVMLVVVVRAGVACWPAG